MEWVCQKILLYISVNYFFIVKHKYPGAKKFCYKPSAIIAELETLFSRVLGTGSISKSIWFICTKPVKPNKNSITAGKGPTEL